MSTLGICTNYANSLLTRTGKYARPFISLIEGQIDISTDAASNDIDVQLIEHLDAIGGGVSDMQKSMQRRFDIMVAVAQGAPVPPCP